MTHEQKIPFQIPIGIHVVKEAHFDFASIRLRSDGIVQINSKEDMLFSINETTKVHEAVNELNNNGEVYILHVPGLHTNADDETRRFLSSEKGLKNRKALAFVLQSMPQKIVANFFLKINKPKIPTKFFNDQEAAENWLISTKVNEMIKK